jgi:dihydroxy-acid dehydratase
MRSDEIKNGNQRAPNRSLLRSLGVTDREMDLPFIGIANALSDIVPVHVHLRTLAQKVREGITAAGGVPFELRGTGRSGGQGSGAAERVTLTHLAGKLHTTHNMCPFRYQN